MNIQWVRLVLGAALLAGGVSGLGIAAEPLPDAMLRLKSPEVIKRRVAAQEIINLRNPESAPALLNALSDKDAYVRTLAARGLGYLRWSAGKDKLAESALKDPSSEVRQTALMALRFIGEPTTIPTFEKALKDPADAVRSTAVGALGNFKSASAVPALIEASKDKSLSVRRNAYAALGQIGVASAEPALMAGLKDSDAVVRANAAQGLGFIKARAAIPALKEMLKDSSPLAQVAAAQALAMQGDTTGRPVVMDALKGQDKIARLMAIETLGWIKDPGTLTWLESLSKDPDMAVRMTAEQALQKAKKK